MLSISRTRVPETWLSNLPLTPAMGYKALDKRTMITIENSRFSVSTINSDLFPELLSWSAIMDAQSASPASPCVINIPSDVPAVPHAPDTDTVIQSNFDLSSMFDPTTIGVGFDESCLNGLDDLLIHSPMDAFAEACWTEAIGSPSRRSVCASTPTPFPLPRAGRTRHPLSRLVTSPFLDVSDTDDDDCPTYEEEPASLASILGAGDIPAARTVGGLPSYTEEKSSYSDGDGITSFILFEPHFPVPDPKDSVGFFPIPTTQQHSSVPKRFAKFCSNLPARSLSFVRS
ncbi:hypothetical protein B0H34DRAFT_381656 [Crassisporium funariophilum]|nr:hypothetical protein B0H34DRAFT_381656 [Crassisporium funariophilum]